MFKVKKKTKITSLQFEQEVKTYLESPSGQFAGVTEIWRHVINMKVCSADVKDDSTL
jgi:hypothetical protein